MFNTTFIEIIKKPIVIVLMIVALIVLIVLGSLLYFFIIKRNHEVKIAETLEKKYRKLHGILTEDIEMFLARVKKISEQNVEYVQILENFRDVYNDILQDNDRNSFIAVSGLRNIFKEKKFAYGRSLIESTKNTVGLFERRVNKLYDDLNNILAKEEEFKQNEVALQRKFRELKENYANHSTELKVMENSFNKIFDRIEQMFIEAENLASAARYDEANDKLPIISQILNEIDKAFVSLPSYCVRITSIIPSKMEEVRVKFEELEGNEYPLHHLKVMTRLEGYKQTLNDLLKRIERFDLNGVGQELDNINNDIMQIFKSFNDEEEAKAFFDANCDAVYNDSYDLENQFKKIKRTLPQYIEVYAIKDKYLDKVHELEKGIDSIQNIKRELDNYIHSSTRQPYTIICQKIHDIADAKQRISDIIVDFNNYLVSLKTDSDKAYREICSYFIKLKDAEYQLREMAVPAYSDRLRVSFDRAYNYLEQIGDALRAKPIDVALANDTLEVATEAIESLLKDIKEHRGLMEYAENAIVHANEYRQGFIDCKFALNNAGQSFYEGDFGRTIDETVSIIKKMKPDITSNQ